MKRETKRSTDLCDSCERCTKVSGYGRELKVCHALDLGDGVQINFPVEKCGSYEAKGASSKYEMEQMAIYIEKRKDAPGFKFSKRVDGLEIEFK